MIFYFKSRRLQAITALHCCTNCEMQSKPSAAGNWQRAFLCNMTTPLFPSRESRVAQAVRACGFEQVNYSPYSPDLGPSDFHLFPHLRKELRGHDFQSDEELIDCVTELFDTKDSEFYRKGISALRERWNRVRDVDASYKESKHSFLHLLFIFYATCKTD